MEHRNIPTTNEIVAFFHCGKCLAERPEDISPRDWAQLEVGWTTLGFQVWCKRHEVNVNHVDFLGQRMTQNTCIELDEVVDGEIMN